MKKAPSKDHFYIGIVLANMHEDDSHNAGKNVVYKWGLPVGEDIDTVYLLPSY